MAPTGRRTGRRTGARRRFGTLGLGLALLGGAGLPGLQSGPPTLVGAPAGAVRPSQIAEGPRGTWQVSRVDEGAWRLAWRSPGPLPVTSDRPTIVTAGGAPVGVPTVAADRRTVQVVVRSATRPGAAGFDVLLSGDRLDVTGADVAARRAPGPAPEPGPLPVDVLPEDPGTPGPHAVVSSDYELPGVRISGMPDPVEMVGHVVEPVPGAATGPRPLVLFMHGRHTFCYEPGNPSGGGFDWPCEPPEQEIPSHLGYRYLQRLLASHGYATVSVRVNGINAQDFARLDGGAAARARIVRAHLDHWGTLAPGRQVDLSRVTLVGHSRGGEGVNRASLRTPIDAPYRIVGQVLLAPTNFGQQTAPYVPTVTLLPSCDGDVFDLQGQLFTDVARDLTTDDTSLKSSVLVGGANHNYFNTEWTPGIAVAPSFDDWFLDGPGDPCAPGGPHRLTSAEQRNVGAAYVAGAVRLFSEDAQQFLPLYDGSRATVASVGDADVRTHALGGGREVRRPGLGTGRSLPVGAESQLCRGVQDVGAPNACGRTSAFLLAPHWGDTFLRAPVRRFLEVEWDAPGESAGLVFTRALDLTGDRLELRTIVDPVVGSVRVGVRLTDTAGASAEVTPSDSGLVPALGRGPGFPKRWAQTLLVDPAQATGVDLGAIRQVEVVGRSPDGRLWVADLSAAPATLAPVPDRRLPTLNLGSLRQVEGDGPGQVTARVPFRVVGDLTRPARFTGELVGSFASPRRPFTVDLAPGQTSGSIPVTYEADRRDDLDGPSSTLVAWGTREVMTDAYLGVFALVDDDPTPTFAVRTGPVPVREGRTVQIRGVLGAPVDYDVFVLGRLAEPRGRSLTDADVPEWWLEQRVENRIPGAPLHRQGIFLFTEVRSGGTLGTLSIPIRRDGVREPPESVRMLVTGFPRFPTRSRTVWVVDR